MKIKKYYEKHRLPLIISIVVLGILLLTVGFSAFGQKLFITGMFANVRVPADIRVTGIIPSKNNSDGVSNSEDYDVKSIVGNITLPNADSSVTYEVQVTNFEGPEMGIYDLTGLPDNLEYVLEEYNLKDKICEGDKCTLGVQKKFKITIKYKDGMYNANKDTFDFQLDFDFRSYHKVSYDGFTYSDSYPKEVMDKDTLEFNFNESEKTDKVKVTMDDVDIENFKIEGQKFTLENVTGDVVIKYTTTKTTPFLEFMKEQSLGDDETLNFYDENIVSGVYLNHETIAEEYPVYYYRGVVDNNAIYANYCWKIVRSTKNGGIKLIFNGKVSNGICDSSHDYLGSEPFNQQIIYNGENRPTPSQVGYMYDKTRPIQMIAPSNLKDTSNPKVIDVGIKFGNDVKWDGSKYTLVDTITINDLDQLEDDIRGGSYGNYSKQTPNAFHYTCLNAEESCDKVYYVYYNDYGNSHDTNASGLYGIVLDNGMNVTDTIDELLFKSNNTTSSYVKNYIDEWFQGKGDDFKRDGGDALINHKDEIDDVPWCNDRKVAGYHGWDINSDNHAADNKYLHFSAFGRLVGDNGVLDRGRPDITCDIPNDAFTVSKSNGNGALDYPVGMLTADEAVLAGAIYDVVTDNYLRMKASKDQFFMTPYYISDDHVRMFTLAKEGKLDSGYASNQYAIRPAIALKNTMGIKTGTGTTSDPYIIGSVS